MTKNKDKQTSTQNVLSIVDRKKVEEPTEETTPLPIELLKQLKAVGEVEANKLSNEDSAKPAARVSSLESLRVTKKSILKTIDDSKEEDVTQVAEVAAFPSSEKK